jgi:DUF971 family protein
MSLTIKKISRIKDDNSVTDNGIGIRLTFTDTENNETTFEIPSQILRKKCPCASCQQKRGDTSHDRPLTGGSRLLRVISATSEEECKLEKIWLLGNYAIGMKWADGHDSGIYTFQFLRELSNQE